MKVDISASRSMWFGESEKIIKKVFEDYKSYATKQSITPILFFNEADAVIAKRKEANSSSVSNTENRIQNIVGFPFLAQFKSRLFLSFRWFAPAGVAG